MITNNLNVLEGTGGSYSMVWFRLLQSWREVMDECTEGEKDTIDSN